jgi:hypothetical protein
MKMKEFDRKPAHAVPNLKAPAVENFYWIPVGAVSKTKTGRGSVVSLI